MLSVDGSGQVRIVPQYGLSGEHAWLVFGDSVHGLNSCSLLLGQEGIVENVAAGRGTPGTGCLLNLQETGWLNRQANTVRLVVQLPRFVTGVHNDWPQLRETQRQAANRLDDTHLVVTIDTGDANDIHPTDKAPVANHVAALALQEVYGKSVSGRSPSPARIEPANGKVMIRFESVGSGLGDS